eukprot:CAMPEP_0198122944 /NCGR_PEP_ID=MMETSP1442-20131203/36263_1 /TAXON_ID= /ORGANISM="Craspedostauros australis, Strain CCMP3328" /LENGTH=290 /DNA_ID=CAMNT_0043782061 /DNA_START=31 /DNA_END=903 /DNA_ORIENTATION=+
MTASAFAPMGNGVAGRVGAAAAPSPAQQQQKDIFRKGPSSNAVATRNASPLFARGGAKAQKNVLQKILPAIGSAMTSVAAALSSLSTLQKTLFAAIFVLGHHFGRNPPIMTPYRDSLSIPARFYGPNAPLLHGRAVSVSDGDTIRFYHLPYPWQKPPEKIKVSQVALAVRLCTMDTPETPKFGKPGQPFGLEAKEELTKFLGKGKISIRILQKDQYGRCVAQVIKDGKHADEHMLKKGLAEVYTGGGAVYGPKGLEKYQEMEKAAQKKKLGIWSKGKRESAAEYKKRTKE